MTICADVIIIGGGVTGLSTAIHLKERGVQDVVVLERHSIGSGQSGRAAGVIRGTVQHPTVSATQLEGQSFFRSFSARFGIPLQVNEVGYLLVGQSRDRAYIEKTAAVADAAGCQLSEVSVSDARRLQPGLNVDDNDVFLYEPGALFVDPMPATQAMLIAAKSLGVTVIEGCEVEAVSVKGNVVQGVETSKDRFSSSRVLIATSVWGQPQLARLGIEVPVRPHIAQMAFCHVPFASQHRLQRIVFDSRVGLYMRPEHESQMFVGRRESDFYQSNDVVDPDNYRQTATYDGLTEITQGLSRTLDFMRDGFVHRSYACTYDTTPDEMPILDRGESVAGLYFAVGFSGGGFSTSPWVGNHMADFIAEDSKPAEIELFGLDRFASGELIRWSNTPTGP